MDYLITFLLLALSALFSGLTLGYFTLNVSQVRRQAKLGDAEAIKILPIREKGNQLLTTLLLGNVAVNSILAVFLSSIAGGVIAATIATSLIFLFGEIIPQAVLSRHGKWFGALVAPLVRFLMLIASPVTLPIAWLLDHLLGHEMPSIYSKDELKELVSEHGDSEHSQLDKDEERIIHGALQFSHTIVAEVMTPKDQVISFDQDERLTEDFYIIVNDHGYSRYPVHSGNKNNVVGVLFTKDLLIEESNITIKETREAFEPGVLTVRDDAYLDTVLSHMLKKRQHLAIVHNKQRQYVGVVSLEDIIEEIIQVEIEDEDDVEN